MGAVFLPSGQSSKNFPPEQKIEDDVCPRIEKASEPGDKAKKYILVDSQNKQTSSGKDYDGRQPIHGSSN